jgi:formylglycine-generating enzyme required for sulfatase activity
MNNKFCTWFVMGALLVGLESAAAQTARFFRVSGPTAITISALHPDGTLIFSNAQAGATYTVQTISALGGGTNWVDYLQIPAPNSVVTNQILDFRPPPGMARIPAGSFMMGDVADTNYDGDAAPTPVYVSALYLDQADVTYALWQQVYNWAITHGYSFDNVGSGLGTNYPVQAVNWYDCVKWCNARSEMEGRMPAYYTTAAQTVVYRTGDIDLANSRVNWQAGYRLPTEAEWEKAARGGLSGQRFPWGNTISQSQANYYGDPGYFSYDLGPAGNNTNFGTGAGPYTSPVKSFAANGYGLYDMAGNEWQWCWDWYATPYAGGSDPRGPTTGSFGLLYRVQRGGFWNGAAVECRAAYRDDYYPNRSYSEFGFRSALPASQ